jgi:hypothetical protein
LAAVYHAVDETDFIADAFVAALRRMEMMRQHQEPVFHLEPVAVQAGARVL